MAESSDRRFIKPSNTSDKLMKHRFPALAAAAALAAAIASNQLPALEPSYSLDLNLPSLGTVAGAELSPTDERAIGQQMMNMVRASPSFMTDPEITEYLNTLGYQLVSHAKTYTYNFSFFPIRNKTLNAFAMPGGFIAVHTGTIVSAKNESELAGVLGHEIGHVSQRHIARIFEAQKSNLALTLGSVLLAVLAARAGGSSGGDAASAIVLGSQAAMIQNQLNYSQDAEREADRIGLQTLSNAGFDPRGMEAFFKRLQFNNRFYESAAPAYLSTHPLTTSRIADMENRTRTMRSKMHDDSIEFPLIQARAEVLQETKTDELYRTRSDFERRIKEGASGISKCAALYGLSVASAELNEHQKAYEYAKQAFEMGYKSFILERNLVRTAYNAATDPKTKAELTKRARDGAASHPFSISMAENYIDILYDQKMHDEIISFLRNGSAITEANPDYHAVLARSYADMGKESLRFMHTGEMYALSGETEAAVYQFNKAQQANDGDFFTMSEIDARLRELRDQLEYEKSLRK